MMKPPCADWNIWTGAEIEGTEGVGVSTLFIRSLADYIGISPLNDFSGFAKKSGCQRVWFCKEFYRSEPTDNSGNFIAWGLVRAIGKHFSDVCIEAEPKDLQCIPKDLKKTARIYLKINVELKPGDFVCIGPTFSDESFKIGTGAKVKPDDYHKDIKIK